MSPGRAWASIGTAFILAAGLSGCGSSGPAPLSIRCSGPTLTSPDTSEVDSNGPVSPPPVAAVPGTPRAESGTQLPLPGTVDPDNPSLGYEGGGKDFSLSLMSDTGEGQPEWTAELRAPSSVSGADSSLYAPDTHYGYAIMQGGSLKAQYITAVSSAGQQGPACVVPQLPTADNDVELLPHAGVLIIQNPLIPSTESGDFRLDGYSTSTGQRLWSVPANTAYASGKVKYELAGDTVYIWEDASGDVAAYNAVTGQHLWTTSRGSNNDLSDDGLLGAFGGHVYAAFDDGTTVNVAAIDGVHGTISWKTSFPSPLAISSVGITQVGTSELLLGDSVRHQMLLLSARNGKILAKATSSSPGAAANNQEQVCEPGGHLAVAVPEPSAIHVLSDDPAYDRTITIPQANIDDIAVSATVAYVLPSQAGAPVYGYDLATGKLLWTVPVPPGSSSEAVLSAFDGGFMVQGSSHTTLYR